MGRTRKVKRISRRRTNRVKRSRINNKRVKRSKRTRINNKRTKRKSRMKRGGYLGEGIRNRLMRNNSIRVGDEINTSGVVPNQLIRNMDGRPGTQGNSQRRVNGLGRYKVIGTQSEGKFGRKQKYLLLEGNLKILEGNAIKYKPPDLQPAPSASSGPVGAKAGAGGHMDGI
jgi:hypothetical protein